MNVPKLRFLEYCDEWKKVKIEDLFDTICIKNKQNETVLTIIQGIGTVPRKESGRNIIYDDKSLRDYKYVEKNQFIIHLRSFESGFEIANGNGIVSPAYTILNPKQYLNSYLYKNYFRTYKFINKTIARAVTGIRDGKSINYDDLKKESVYICSKNEQEKIANFLSLLDKKIELQTKKIEALKLFKKGFTKFIFSNYKYKILKVKDVLDFEQPNKYIFNSDIFTDDVGSIPVLTANKSFILGYCKENNYYDKGKSIIFDDFTMNMKFTNFNYKVKSSAIKILTAKGNNDLKFLYELLLSLDLSSDEHKRHYISYVQEIKLKIPDYKIQKDISSKLNIIDKKIYLEKNIYDNLIKLKEGLMQQLFI